MKNELIEHEEINVYMFNLPVLMQWKDIYFCSVLQEYKDDVGIIDELCIGRDRKKSERIRWLRDGWLTKSKDVRLSL